MTTRESKDQKDSNASTVTRIPNKVMTALDTILEKAVLARRKTRRAGRMAKEKHDLAMALELSEIGDLVRDIREMARDALRGAPLDPELQEREDDL